MVEMSQVIRRIDVTVYRAPIETPVMTSFGNMTDRPAVIVRLQDQDGVEGWGEVWCNYPTCGAEHRAKLIETVFEPLLIGYSFEAPPELFDYLTERSHVLAIQTAEVGPIAQCIAGLDIAAWDLTARKSGLPLHRLLGSDVSSVSVYASGVNPTDAPETIERARRDGYRAFKVKIGFGHDEDLAVLSEAYSGLSTDERLMADANQAWTLDQAQAFVDRIGDIPLSWLEEPLRADRPDEEWHALAEQTKIPIAAGENVRGQRDFEHKINSGYLGVVQPDICKWGGISANLPIVSGILAAGVRYCPHYLGGGIGLVASAHLLAAVGGDGTLEVDYNTNPLREGLANPLPAVRDGTITLTGEAGLGVKPDLDRLREFVVA